LDLAAFPQVLLQTFLQVFLPILLDLCAFLS
jgi:hypothetical protein